MDRPTLAKCMAKLGAAFGRTIEQDVLVTFHAALSRYSNAVVEGATEDWINTQERFPTPSQLIVGAQAVLRRQQNQRADTHGISEHAESGQMRLDGDTLHQQRMTGLQTARAALAAARAKHPTPETGDE